MDETSEAAFIANRVNDPWHAFTISVNAPEGWSGEIRGTFGAGHGQTMLDVASDLVELEWLEVIADGDPLAEVLEFGLVEMVAELRLAHENDLEQFALVGFEVREKADLLQEFVGHVLRFIDNENRFLLFLDQAEKKFI